MMKNFRCELIFLRNFLASIVLQTTVLLHATNHHLHLFDRKGMLFACGLFFEGDFFLVFVMVMAGAVRIRGFGVVMSVFLYFFGC